MSVFSSFEKFNQSQSSERSQKDFRQSGFDYAVAKGLPTRQDEDWHYTSVKLLSETEYEVSSERDPLLVTHEILLKIKKHLSSDFFNLVFVNGIFNQTLSDELPANVTLKTCAEWPTTFADTFDALNGAYLTQGWDFFVAPESSVDKPVNFVFYSTHAEGRPLMIHPRLNINVGVRSCLRFLESYYGDAAQAYFVNSVTHLDIQSSANVTYVRLQNDSIEAVNIGRSQISLAENAHLQSLAYSTGARLSRHSLNLLLQGERSFSDVLGLYSVTGRQHVDNTTVIDHAVGGCDTNQLYKGILDQESRAVFNGKVLIRKNSQKANSAQLNNNLLLSPKAEADSKPNLEIHADDVKASHGSTVGQLDSEEVFYLQSRAIPKEKAIPMLSYGYLSEVIHKISDESIQKFLRQHLDQAFQRLTVAGK